MTCKVLFEKRSWIVQSTRRGEIDKTKQYCNHICLARGLPNAFLIVVNIFAYLFILSHGTRITLRTQHTETHMHAHDQSLAAKSYLVTRGLNKLLKKRHRPVFHLLSTYKCVKSTQHDESVQNLIFNLYSRKRLKGHYFALSFRRQKIRSLALQMHREHRYILCKIV